MNHLGFIRFCSVSLVGATVAIGLFFIPRVGLTNNQNVESQHSTVTFTVVNNYEKRICLQGKLTTTPICVGAHQSRSISEPNTFMIDTAYFYTTPGLVHYWFGHTKNDMRKMLVAKGEYEVHINVNSDGQLKHKGLHPEAGSDLAEYITWHGLKPLLQS